MIRPPVVRLGLALGLLAAPSGAVAAHIDSFADGALSASGTPLLVAQTQTGLDAAAVIGGARYVEAEHPGALVIDTASGSLAFDHAGPGVGIPVVQYGSFRASLSPLGADLTDGGASDRLLIRVRESLPDGQTPLGVTIQLQSGASQGETFGAGGVAVLLPASATPFVMSVPLDAIDGPIDFTDVDGLAFNYFLQRGGSLVIDAIESGSIPLGDLDANGAVEPIDYVQYERFYGSDTFVAADANGDGVVDAADYTIWRDNLGPPAAAVPEAASLAIGVIAAAPLSIARRRP
ncbi:dockerin type I domain-containing protein [Botrimarina sp.]|uniref:dockerin type I domain-containing protein n=1 Tax=Botrimarina sp. TaxID=2795802 RepID=UPI0032EF9381